jgi:predicted nucleic acid-binding protein
MKAFFDTCVLISVFMEDHEHHEPSLEAFLKADKQQGSCAAHTLAEFYEVVTRLPGRHRLSGDQTLLFLQEIRDRLRIVALTAEEHFRALQDAAGANIVAGAAYEALLMRCAAKAGALTLFTWNVRHFSHLGFSGVERVQTP